MKNTPIFAIDFEGSAKIGIVEYGAAEICGGEIVAAYTQICAPKTNIPERDAEFFDISNDLAQKQKPFSQYLPQFCKMRKRGIFMAHNACVEDSFLRTAIPSPGIVPDFARGTETVEWAPWLDTCALVRALFPTIQSAKLSACIAAFALQEKLDSTAQKFCPDNRRKWHCALYDAIACALLLLKISQFDGMANADISWLAKYSGTPDIGQKKLF